MKDHKSPIQEDHREFVTGFLVSQNQTSFTLTARIVEERRNKESDEQNWKLKSYQNGEKC